MVLQYEYYNIINVILKSFFVFFFYRCVLHRDLKPDNLGFTGNIMKLVRGPLVLFVGGGIAVVVVVVVVTLFVCCYFVRNGSPGTGSPCVRVRCGGHTEWHHMIALTLVMASGPSAREWCHRCEALLSHWLWRHGWLTWLQLYERGGNK